MIDEILQLLGRFSFLTDCRVLQQETGPDGEFVLKIRCRVRRGLTLQIWIKRNPKGIRYSYQLFLRATVLRWDNVPHFANLDNFPHHFHDGRSKRTSSILVGDPMKDLPFVLSEVEKYLAAKT